MIQKKMDSWNFNFNAIPDAERIHILEQIEKTLSEIGATTDQRWKQAARAVSLDENFIHLLDRERRYSAELSNYKQFEEWKNKRNKDRAELEAKFGYDTKHAAHLIRLLRTGKEVLQTGKVNTWRQDADELLAIRRGEWSYEQLIESSGLLEKELNVIYRSGLYQVPKTPDYDKINKLSIEIIKSYLF